MNDFLKKSLTRLAPILGAGAIGVCPLCWLGSASLLTYLGLGTLIPAWRWLAFGLIFLGGVGFILDYRSHKKPYPLIMLVVGGILLYIGRYVFLSTWGTWQIWSPGALLIVAAVIYNKWLFRKPKAHSQKALYQCKGCGFQYKEKEWTEKCEAWCKEHLSCNIEITSHGLPTKQEEA